MKKADEYPYNGVVLNGFVALFCAIVLVAGGAWNLIQNESDANIIIFAVAVVIAAVLVKGLMTQEPNNACVMVFFGKYCGTFDKAGFYWVNPFVKPIRISLRLRNMDIAPIKVNDKVGNPILIGMVLVWRIKNTYKAIFDIASSKYNLDSFVRIQSDAALREVAGHFAYDESSESGDAVTLRSGKREISDQLENTLHDRLQMAGIEVIEARINYLAYAPEIAAVMLKRQQASAIISAREQIVEGAVSMVEMALKRLEKDNIVEMNPDRKARLVSNLLVVLCSEEGTQPVVSADGGDN